MINITTEEIRELIEIALDRELDEFAMEANWYLDYEMDSLAAVALVVEVQKRYSVRIPDERMPEVQTGEQLKAAIEELVAAGPAEPSAEPSAEASSETNAGA